MLVVAAHPDDEILGCGGAIAKYIASEIPVDLLFVSDGYSAREGDSNSKNIAAAERMKAMQAAADYLGVDGCWNLGFADNRLDEYPLLDIVRRIEKFLVARPASIVFTHHYGDLNVDHRKVCSAVMTACRPIPESSVREIYGFEVMSSTEWAIPNVRPFCPNYFIDITEFVDTKMKVLELYDAEMKSEPHSRCYSHVLALAKHRGFSMGRPAAEAFELYRCID